MPTQQKQRPKSYLSYPHFGIVRHTSKKRCLNRLSELLPAIYPGRNKENNNSNSSSRGQESQREGGAEADCDEDVDNVAERYLGPNANVFEIVGRYPDVRELLQVRVDNGQGPI